MTPAVIRWRRHGADDRRFARMLAASLAIHGVFAWLFLYHLEHFSPTHLPSAYLVELLTPASVVPEPQMPAAEEIPLLTSPEPVPQKFKAPPPELPPKPVPLGPPPRQIPDIPPPPPMVAQKAQPELAPPQSLQRNMPPPATPSSQLHESVVSRTAAPRDLDLASPTLTRPQGQRPEHVASLPESPALPSARRSQDDVVGIRSAPNYQSPRQPSKETLPESSRGLTPTASSRGDVAVPDSLPRRAEPRSPRSEPFLPDDRGQQIAARSHSATIAAPQGPSSAPRVSRTAENDTLPMTSSSGFTPPANRNNAIPLPGGTGTAPASRPAAVGAGSQMPTDRTPRLQAASPQARLDQTSLAAFRSLKTCLDTEQESRLKMTLAKLLAEDATCTSGSTQYFFAATETSYSLQVGIAAGAGQVFKDRCDALQQAVRCVEQSRK